MRGNPFVRKVLRYRKNTTFLSVGSIIPRTWKYVVIEILEKGEDYVVIKLKRLNHDIEKLLEAKENEAKNSQKI